MDISKHSSTMIDAVWGIDVCSHPSKSFFFFFFIFLFFCQSALFGAPGKETVRTWSISQMKQKSQLIKSSFSFLEFSVSPAAHSVLSPLSASVWQSRLSDLHLFIYSITHSSTLPAVLDPLPLGGFATDTGHGNSNACLWPLATFPGLSRFLFSIMGVFWGWRPSLVYLCFYCKVYHSTVHILLK